MYCDYQGLKYTEENSLYDMIIDLQNIIVRNYTIQIPKDFKNQMEGWAFGCDICQDVCPWNKFSHPHQTSSFSAHEKLEELHKEDWTEMTEDIFKEVFKKSAVKRAGYMKLKQSIDFIKE